MCHKLHKFTVFPLWKRLSWSYRPGCGNNSRGAIKHKSRSWFAINVREIIQKQSVLSLWGRVLCVLEWIFARRFGTTGRARTLEMQIWCHKIGIASNFGRICCCWDDNQERRAYIKKREPLFSLRPDREFSLCVLLSASSLSAAAPSSQCI